MDETILVPTNGSPPSRQAVEYAVEHVPDASSTLLYVVVNPIADYSRHRAYPGYTQEDEFRPNGRVESTSTSRWSRIPEDHSVEMRIEVGTPARTIVRYADEHDIDQIVKATVGRCLHDTYSGAWQKQWFVGQWSRRPLSVCKSEHLSPTRHTSTGKTVAFC